MTGWGSLLEKDSIDKRDQKNRKKEKKLQQIDMFGNNDSDNSGRCSKFEKKMNWVVLAEIISDRVLPHYNNITILVRNLKNI